MADTLFSNGTVIVPEWLNEVNRFTWDAQSSTATKGADLIGANDGAGGTVFTKVGGFITKILSSTGSGIVGFLPSGTGAVVRTVLAKLRDEITVQDFGAVGDGVTDDSAAFQAALNTGKKVYAPSTTNGYKINTTLVFNSGNSLVGDARKTKIVMAAGVVFADIRVGNVVIENLIVDHSTGAGGNTFRLNTSNSSIDRVFIRNVETLASTLFLYDDAHASNIAVYILVENCVAKLHRGPGVWVNDIFAYFKMSHVTIDYVGSASRNHIGVSMTANQGAQFTHVDVTNGLVDATTTNAHGFAFQNCIAVWLTDCMADTCGGSGFYVVGGCSYLYFSGCVGSLNGGTQFNVGSSGGTSQKIGFSNCTANGRVGLPYAPSAQGFSLLGTSISINGSRAYNNTGHGFLTASGGTNHIYSGNISSGNTGFGFAAVGTGTALFSSSLFSTNTAGNGFLTGSFQHITMCQLNSGALLTSSTGPATV